MVYTEYIYKLYELNPKITISRKDQVSIFRDIIEGVELLSAKFEQFVPTKDMVGYNTVRKGKAWIH